MGGVLSARQEVGVRDEVGVQADVDIRAEVGVLGAREEGLRVGWPG